MEIVVLLLGLLFAIVLQTIIHEIGHLVCGLMTGYSFISFRIFGIVFYKEQGHLRVGYSRAPGAGQAILSPHFAQSDRIPYVLYNAGGLLFNLISGILLGGVSLLLHPDGVVHTLLVCMAWIGLFLAIFGAIPIPSLSVSYDACNLWTLTKDSNARYAFWRLLKIEEVLQSGQSYRTCPKEWFDDLPKPDYRNPLLCGYSLYKIYWLTECGRFAEALALCDAIIAEPGALPAYQNSAQCERAFCAMLLEADGAASNHPFSLPAPVLQKRCDPIANYHVLYAQAKLIFKDEHQAAHLKHTFEKKCAAQGCAGEIAHEKTMFSMIDAFSCKA